MVEDIYSKLRERLDTYGLGYPETESGVDPAIKNAKNRGVSLF